MADEDGQLMGPEARRRLDQLWKWRKNFSVRGAAECRNTEDTCTIVVFPSRPTAAPASAKLPVGEFAGMVYMMVADNEAGFAFEGLVSTPPA